MKIVATGRGGTGKSTFIALAAKYLNSPLLLIDLDPDQSLAEMVGIDLEKEKIKTISDVLFDLKKGSDEIASMPVPDKLEYLLHASCLYESKDFDLITLGVKWTRGCYCMPNNILRDIIPEIARNYAYTLVDSPAGLEHLNRTVLSEVDDIFIIVDHSQKSIREVERIPRLAQTLNIKFTNLYIVGNYRLTKEMEAYFQHAPGIYAGKIEYDGNVEKFNIEGKSLLELPDDSFACLSVKEILKKTHYMTK